MKVKSTFLVTGGCGFIGSHLSDELVRQGNRVIILDNLSTGKKTNLQESAEVVVGDICDTALVSELMQRVDGCFHLAAIASVELCNRDWLNSHRVNLSGAINIFNAARKGKNNVSVPVVYTSSAAIYGDNKNTPLKETEKPNPLTAYGADKIGCEYHARVATLVHGVPTTGLRLFNVYGPRQDPRSVYSGVISIFLDSLLSNKALKIYGTGQQTRDFVYVQDVVRFFITSMQKKSMKSPVYNVCTGKSTSIKNLALLLGKLCDKSPKLIYLDPRSGDIYRSLGNPAKAKRELGMQAKASLVYGLAELI